MANEEHLKILRQGVEVWNKWQEDNPDVKPDLRAADLRKANLSGAYLFGASLLEANLLEANLSDTNLSYADLSYTDLSHADLSYTDLSHADLSHADLSEANLSEANLSYVNLSYAKLIKADLEYANLTGADLINASLTEANVIDANLSDTNLSKANILGIKLSRALLTGADLSGLNLSRTNLMKKDLSGANLSGANLQNAYLKAARLIKANLDGANITEAYLWETQRAGWSIKGIICESVYWHEWKEEKTVYGPGEFERLFAEQTKIRLSYKDGISLFEIGALPTLIQHLEQMQGYSLRFVSINEGAGGAVVELAIENIEEKSSEEIDVIKQAIQAEAELDIQILRDEVKFLSGKVEGYENSLSLILRDRRGDTYNFNDSQIGAAGPHAHAHGNTFNQLVNQSIDLAALAKELSELRQAIKDKQYSSPQADIALVKVAEAEIAATEKDTPKVIEHLKSAGKWTMDFAKELGKDVVVAAIKQAMGLP